MAPFAGWEVLADPFGLWIRLFVGFEGVWRTDRH